MKPPPSTSLLNQCRLLANKLLALAGVEIVRRPRRRISGLIPIQIGKYLILMRENNALWVQYANNPDYSAQLGRLATKVFHAYPNALMIDVGANVGDTAAIVKTAMDVPIICIEGDPAVLPLLRQNVAPMKTVTACQHYLGERMEDVEVIIQKEGWDSTIVPVKSGEFSTSKTMSLVKLDEVVAGLALPHMCKLLKVDVEGFDFKVLRGASSLLQKDKPVIIFEWNHQNLEQIGEASMGIFPYLSALDYEDILIFDGQGDFMMPGKVTDAGLLQDLYDYSRNLKGLFYYDICVFPKQDSNMASDFLSAERGRRKAQPASNANGASWDPAR
jgi:FkbM family methyltransferase